MSMRVRHGCPLASVLDERRLAPDPDQRDRARSGKEIKWLRPRWSGQTSTDSCPRSSSCWCWSSRAWGSWRTPRRS